MARESNGCHVGSDLISIPYHHLKFQEQTMKFLKMWAKNCTECSYQLFVGWTTSSWSYFFYFQGICLYFLLFHHSPFLCASLPSFCSRFSKFLSPSSALVSMFNCDYDESNKEEVGGDHNLNWVTNVQFTNLDCQTLWVCQVLKSLWLFLLFSWHSRHGYDFINVMKQIYIKWSGQICKYLYN